jgi:hypothetical protein
MHIASHRNALPPQTGWQCAGRGVRSLQLTKSRKRCLFLFKYVNLETNSLTKKSKTQG